MIGEQLRRYRDLAVLTQDELARRARLSPSTVASLELNQHAARPTTIRKLARALGIKPTQLVAAE